MGNFSFYDWLIETGDLGEGPGLWCPLHLCLIALLFVWIAFCYFIFSRKKEFALKCTKWLCFFMIFSRVLRTLLLIFSGKESVLSALPWHLCHVMAIVFPIFYLSKTKKFFLPVIFVTLFGGILTFLFGDYYCYSVLSFLQIESLLLHFIMPTVCMGVLASGYFKIDLKEFWQVPLLTLALVCYAEIGNRLVEGANFLFLRKNGLPFNLFNGAHFFYTYIILLSLVCLSFVLPIMFSWSIKKRKIKKYRLFIRQNVDLKK